jgi:hypothetical protein
MQTCCDVKNANTLKLALLRFSLYRSTTELVLPLAQLQPSTHKLSVHSRNERAKFHVGTRQAQAQVRGRSRFLLSAELIRWRTVARSGWAPKEGLRCISRPDRQSRADSATPTSSMPFCRFEPQ